MWWKWTAQGFRTLRPAWKSKRQKDGGKENAGKENDRIRTISLRPIFFSYFSPGVNRAEAIAAALAGFVAYGRLHSSQQLADLLELRLGRADD